MTTRLSTTRTEKVARTPSTGTQSNTRITKNENVYTMYMQTTRDNSLRMGIVKVSITPTQKMHVRAQKRNQVVEEKIGQVS